MVFVSPSDEKKKHGRQNQRLGPSDGVVGTNGWDMLGPSPWLDWRSPSAEMSQPLPLHEGLPAAPLLRVFVGLFHRVWWVRRIVTAQERPLRGMSICLVAHVRGRRLSPVTPHLPRLVSLVSDLGAKGQNAGLGPCLDFLSPRIRQPTQNQVIVIESANVSKPSS